MAPAFSLAVSALPVGLTLFGALAVAFGIAGWLSVFRNESFSGGEKAMWFFAILIFPLFGSLVYFTVRRSW